MAAGGGGGRQLRRTATAVEPLPLHSTTLAKTLKLVDENTGLGILLAKHIAECICW